MSEVEYAEPDPEQYNAWVAGLAIEEVQLVKLAGERKVAGEPASLGFGFTGGFANDAVHLRIRYEVSAGVLAEDGTVLTDIEASVVVVLTMSERGTPECYNRFAGSNGALMAHPYLREVVQATAARLGHPGVIVPMATAIPLLPASSAEIAER